MTASFWLALVVGLLPAPAPAAQDVAAIERLAWLEGCWTLPRADGYTEEVWLRPAGGAMLGVNRTIRGGRMTTFEHLAIRSVDGALSYVASPSGQATTAFALVRVTDAEAVFENPAHDFPQRIIYRRTAAGLAARIEGSRDGQARSVDFPFVRCRR